jgi:hypothetical protein
LKSKTNTYILLGLVVVVWGALIYQFFSYANPDIQIEEETDFSIKPLTIKDKDSFGIEINPRDPFLGKVYVENQIPKVAKKPKTIKVKEPIVWAQIEYKGIVSDKSAKVKVFMVIIDGKSFLMKKGDIEKEITLKDGDRESIDLMYEGELDTFYIL